MAHCRKPRSAHCRGKGVQTRSATHSNYSRRLRKRRLSLRYTEDDLLAESIELHSAKIGEVTDDEVRFTFDSTSASKLFQTTTNETPKRREMSQVPCPAVDEQLSDRDSVVSCDSYDSGVGSRSDDERVILPSTPEKDTGKPITIEVVSPASRGVIELIENGSNGYIGYFKPSSNCSSNTKTSDCTNCALLKRTRLTRRSISTNVSEDSNDSAFQGFRSSRHHDTNDAIKYHNDTVAVNKSSKLKTKKKKVEATRHKCRDNILTPKCRDNILTPKRRKSEVKASSKASSVGSHHSSPLHRRKLRVTSKQAMKCSPAKRALLRIQHHNRSPERPDEAVTPATITARNCRTRSHAKSLMKDVVTSPSLTSIKTSTTRPKHSLRRNSLFAKSAIHYGPNEQSAERSPHLSRSPRSVPSLNDSLKGEDSGVGSDDQRSVTSSACHWRFCKTEVSPADLADHMERLHVASQRRNSKVYKCYWEGCKVYGKVAKSIIWLEGHVKKHLGARPYYCIFAGCSAKFPSQELLQRHVDTHIDDVEPVRTAKKVEPSLAKKNEKKKIKRLRGTEKCIPKRADFFTNNILEAVCWENKMLQENWSHILSEERDSLKLHGQIVAMATTGDVERVQIHWFPEQLQIADSWHDRTDEIAESRSKEVKLSSLDRHWLISMLQANTC